MGPSRMARDTTTARTTPRISIITWMVVEECAGSMPNHSSIRGRMAPRQMLLKTIRARAAAKEGKKVHAGVRDGSPESTSCPTVNEGGTQTTFACKILSHPTRSVYSLVTAIASGNGVLKATARQNPAMERMKLNEAAIFASRARNCPRVRSLRVPRARPRMTDAPRQVRREGAQAGKGCFALCG
jgi:hypothetical protein